MVQILEQSQRTGYLCFSVLLKAKTQGNGERRADHSDYDDPVIVLNIGSHLSVHFVLNFPLHAGIATPDERSAASWESAWLHSRRRRQTPSSTGVGETLGPRAKHPPERRSQTLYRDKPPSDAGTSG